VIDIDLRVTLTTQERQAWQIVRPILKAYLTKIFRLYRHATPAQKEELLAHNPILAAVVEMVGDD
jgi:hypothetical protein